MPPKGTARSTTARLQDQMAKAQAFSFFSTSIQDPNNPLYCGMCIDGALIACTQNERKIFEQEGRPDIKSTRTPKCDPDVWNAVVRFMFYQRTDEQMKRLVDRLSDCKCRVKEGTDAVERYHGIAGFHYEEEGAYAELNSFFNHTEYSWVVDLFEILYFATAGIKFITTSKALSKSWPISFTDLFPFGTENFVQSILQWHHLIPHPVIIQFMGAVICFSQMLVIPHLIKHRFTDRVIQSTRELVDRAMIDILGVRDMDDMKILMIGFHCRIFSNVAVYFTAISKTAFEASLLRGCETKAFQLCSIILYIFQQCESVCGSILTINPKFYAHIGQEIFRLFHMHLSPLPSFPVHPLLSQADVNAFFASRSTPPLQNESTMRVIRCSRRDFQCTAQGCTNGIQSVGQDFRRCRRCDLVAYCGRECQTNAWKHEQYPHKLVCSALNNLVEKGGGSSLFFSGVLTEGSENPENRPIFQEILQNWKSATVDSDLELIEDWWTSVVESKGYPLPDGTEWTPGYEDYDAVIACLSENGRVPKPKYLNRNARWPPEVERDKRLLKIQPFWGQELDFD